MSGQLRSSSQDKAARTWEPGVRIMMELAVRKQPFLSIPRIHVKPQEQRRRVSFVSSALPETVASVAIAATVVGAAATILVRRNKGAEAAEVPMKKCESCGGSGICPECKGEGFVLKRLSEESAERARLASKNAATRYTAGLPKKWSYCTKCSSARSCSSCGGRGKVVLL